MIILKALKDFQVLGIPLGPGSSYHYMYFREHKSNQSNHENKTLFVGNVDYGGKRSNQEIDSIVRELFGTFGKILSVSLSDNENFQPKDQIDEFDIKNRDSRFVHIMFESKTQLNRALSSNARDFIVASESVNDKYGPGYVLAPKNSAEIQAIFSFPTRDPNDIEIELNEFMKDFEENEDLERKQRLKRSLVPDEDGFIEARPRSKKKRKDVEKRGTGDSRSRTKKKKGELKNFYRFQMRNEKVKKIEDLKKKFEEDKAKIAIMKAQRKFKPF